MDKPFCQSEPPSYWDRLKSMAWRIIGALIASAISAWLGLQPWFWEYIGVVSLVASR
jgi:hypothetical protein